MAGFSRWLMSTTAALGLLTATVSSVSASALLYDDFTGSGTSRWETAITQQLGAAPTSVSDDAAFIAALGGTWDVVVVQFDQGTHAAVFAALQAYVTGGGKVIFSSFADSFDSVNSFDSIFGVTQASVFNSTLVTLPGNLMVDLTLSVTNSALAAGLSGDPLFLECDGCYEVLARSFTGGSSAGLFVDDNSGIVLGNAGKTIINGFQGETLAEGDEIQLYKNELGLLVAAVPEPSTGALLALGAAFTLAARYRRKHRGRE